MENNRMNNYTSPEENISGQGTNDKKKQFLRSNAMSADESTNRKNRAAVLTKLSQHGSLDTHKSDFTDHSGMDLLQFIICTLHKNRNDREMMLSLEKQMRDFIENPEMRALRFPKMCSYNRMLIHRVAAFYGLDHNVDNSASQVICTRTPKTRLPNVLFPTLIRNDAFTDDVQRSSRSAKSFDESRSFHPPVHFRAPRNANPDMMRRTKSVEVDNYQRYIFDNRTASTYSSNSQLSNASTPTMPLAQSFKNLSMGLPAEQRLMESTLKEQPNEGQNGDDVEDSMSYSAVSPFTQPEEVQSTPQYMYPVYDYTHLQAGIQNCSALGYVYVYDTNTQVFVPQPNVDLLSAQLGVLTVNGPTVFPTPGVRVCYPSYQPQNSGYLVSPQMMYPQAAPPTFGYPANFEQFDSTTPGPSGVSPPEVQPNSE